MVPHYQQPPGFLGFLPQCLGAGAHGGDLQQVLTFLALQVLEVAVFQGLPRAETASFTPSLSTRCCLTKMVKGAFDFTEVKMAMLSASLTVTCPERARAPPLCLLPGRPPGPGPAHRLRLEPLSLPCAAQKVLWD